MPQGAKIGNAKVDFISGSGGRGGVAKMLLNNDMRLGPLRTNDTLRKDEWKEMDKTVVDIARRRLRVVNDLVSRGLTYNLTNALGTTVLEYEDASDMEDAQVSMDAAVKVRKDIIEFDIKYLPLPIVHCAFSINIRKLEASRKQGLPLDTHLAQMATAKVAEKIEAIFMTGASTLTFGGGTLYGFTDFTHANSGSLTANWDDTSANILTDVLAMKQASLDDRHFGPWGIYIPPNFETALDEDYVSGYPKGMRQRILEVGGIDFINTSDFLTADNVVMVELRPETVRAVIGLQPTVVEWEEQGGMVLNFLVMAIMVPQLRADQDNRCGIQLWT